MPFDSSPSIEVFIPYLPARPPRYKAQIKALENAIERWSNKKQRCRYHYNYHGVKWCAIGALGPVYYHNTTILGFKYELIVTFINDHVPFGQTYLFYVMKQRLRFYQALERV